MDVKECSIGGMQATKRELVPLYIYTFEIIMVSESSEIMWDVGNSSF